MLSLELYILGNLDLDLFAVWRLIPLQAARLTTEKVPKPMIWTDSFFTALVIALSTALRAASAGFGSILAKFLYGFDKLTFIHIVFLLFIRVDLLGLYALARHFCVRSNIFSQKPHFSADSADFAQENWLYLRALTPLGHHRKQFAKAF